jgi:hypothetical protein
MATLQGHGTVTREVAYLLYFWAGSLGGGMLTIWITSLIFYRCTFFPLEPSDPTPPYGISR